MSTTIAERIKVIDADSHVSEPSDLWTSRVSTQRWGELVPHVAYDEKAQRWRWYMGGHRWTAVAGSAMAGWINPPPSHPPTLEEADHGAWDSRARLQRMDEYGIWAQVIYPNVAGFGAGNFLRLEEPELMEACVMAYNDFLLEWCSVDPRRFIPIVATPFWDVDLAVREINRGAKAGHKGVLMTNQPHVFGMPHVTEPHWDPIWHAAQDNGLSINFHIGSGDPLASDHRDVHNGRQAGYVKRTVGLFLDNSNAIMDIILSGMCERFPTLNFVSVESGIGWIPFLLEALDWQWMNTGGPAEHPEMKLLPSEYFKRQVYGCFWFEEQSALTTIAQLGPDNFLYETDYPHPTSMSPGPASIAMYPKDFIEQKLGGLPEETLHKVLQTNSARIYHLEV